MGDPHNLGTPLTLDLSVDRCPTFKTWKTRWKDYAIITELAMKPNQYQYATLRFTFTEKTQKIYQSLNIADYNITLKS